jgi:LysM repeat protein
MLFDEGPTACPFVALESDRDRRSAEPDPRHRCYAEPAPQPRALAHQREFCLSPGFNGCPIFQDWAVRAAARPVPLRPPGDRDVGRFEQPVQAEQLPVFAPPPVDQAEQAEEIPEFELPPRREPDPAPASFAAGDEQQQGSPAGGAIERIPSLPLQGPPAPGVARAADPPDEPDEPDEPDGPDRPDEPEELAADGPDESDGPEETSERGEGAAPHQPSEPEPPRRRRWEEDWPPSASAAAAASPTVPAARPAPGREARPSPRDEWAAQRADLIPSWERSRYAAYPTFRTRVGAAGDGDLVGRLARVFVLAAAAALVIALLLVPNFLGGFIGGGASPTPAASPTSAASPMPTPGTTPSPTPEPQTQTYVVRPGDTMCRIARIHGLSYPQVVAANPQIADPARIQPGQQVTIPPDDFDPPSPAPGATPIFDPCG